MKKNNLISTGLIAISSLIVGCSDSSTRENPTTSDVLSVSSTNPLPTEDRSGEIIKIPENLTKIVSLVPSVTQILDDLGQSEKLVGIDNQSQLKETNQKVSRFDMMTIDLEMLLALEPQVVFVSDINVYAEAKILKQLKQVGITVINIPTSDTIESIQADVQFVADCVGQHNQGKVLVENMQADIAQLKAMGNRIKQRKTVSFEVAALPEIYSCGSGVFLDEMITTIGAKNVYHDQSGWLAITEESAIERNPDVIFTNVTYIPDPIDEIVARKGWAQVTAIKEKEVYRIDNMTSSLPNHHIVEAMKEMANILYPEAYAQLEFSHV
ncbi:ABC transporter substrate-binding protein [Vagococcus xieshaowenii]|uniref:ABC transporter substrate-binding protein n=2 Tax=Vagococcus xieshaowenii TaxID=2562451 RepID=A0AAJ5EEJ5_9ENTE|nr:ABC transporter substrate-binding protein [Vagococcus xieshaowenii]QCA28142.1 ABC transporter substrate-binding protein [Vagococcus xieshaowenii]TFZ39732.1 ABC transporter substrate-binding protein [Vagococcus xieshaowenii]